MAARNCSLPPPPYPEARSVLIVGEEFASLEANSRDLPGSNKRSNRPGSLKKELFRYSRPASAFPAARGTEG